jgi:hypothetical protein
MWNTSEVPTGSAEVFGVFHTLRMTGGIVGPSTLNVKSKCVLMSCDSRCNNPLGCPSSFYSLICDSRTCPRTTDVVLEKPTASLKNRDTLVLLTYDVSTHFFKIWNISSRKIGDLFAISFNFNLMTALSSNAVI